MDEALFSAPKGLTQIGFNFPKWSESNLARRTFALTSMSEPVTKKWSLPEANLMIQTPE